jgi:hypothetical protein
MQLPASGKEMKRPEREAASLTATLLAATLTFHQGFLLLTKYSG